MSSLPYPFDGAAAGGPEGSADRVSILGAVQAVGEILEFCYFLSTDWSWSKKKARRRSPFAPRGQNVEFVKKLCIAVGHRPDTGAVLADPQKGATELLGLWHWAAEGYSGADLVKGQPKPAVPVMAGVRNGYYIELPPTLHAGESHAVLLLPAAGDQPARCIAAERIKPKNGMRPTGPGLPNAANKLAVLCEWDEDENRTELGQHVALTQEAIVQGVRLALANGLRSAA